MRRLAAEKTPVGPLLTTPFSLLLHFRFKGEKLDELSRASFARYEPSEC